MNIPTHNLFQLEKTGTKAYKLKLFVSVFHRFQLFHDGVPIKKETSQLICFTNQWTGFSMAEASVMKELKSEITTCNPKR